MDEKPTTQAKTSATMPRNHYLNAGYTLRSWLLTLDHKRIAILYLLAITFFFVIGGIAATIARLELMTPQGDLVESETYNKLFTIHGVMMVFFFLIPAIPAVLGNFLVPLMLGRARPGVPAINLLSWYLFMTGGSFTLWAMLAGGVDTGWTFYTPYSSTYSNTYVMMTALGIFISGLLVDPHRPELHRHGAQDARPRPDLVPPAAVHLVACTPPA
jgi:cytochrome c oxidase subunit I